MSRQGVALALAVALLLAGFGLRTQEITALPLYQDETYHLRRAEAVYRFEDNPIAYAHGKLLLYYWLGAFDPAYTEAGLATARLSVALTGLLGAAGEITEQQQHFLETIKQNADRLSTLVNDLLDISRIESGKMALSLEPVAIGDAIEDVVRLMQPLAREKQVTLGLPGPDCQSHVLTDRHRLKQVLLNLVTNGIKYNVQGGSLTITCDDDGEHVTIAVSDTGIGFPEDAIDRLFVPFDRLGREELLARLRAHLRRSQQGSDEPQIRSGDLLIDLASRSITLKGEPVTLTPTEYDILRVLARHAGRVMMHQKLMREVWGHGLQDLHTLRVNISNIRKKIESNPARPQILLTEPGVGYRFVVHEAGA